MYPDKALMTDGRYNGSINDYGRSWSFKLYDENDAAFDGLTYSAYAKIFDDTGAEVLTEISTSVAAGGTGTFAFSSTNKVAINKAYDWEIQLEKSGIIRSFRGLHPIAFLNSPTGTRLP